MAEPQFSTGSDEDLPRTLRRAKAEQAAARGASAGAQPSGSLPNARAATGDVGAPSMTATVPDTLGADRDPYRTAHDTAYDPAAYGDEDRVTVTRFDVPFFRLMGFFLKAVIAAIPALILLAAILWGGGQLLKALFPWLIEAEIVIRLPNG
ncbi:MAG: hypothetical protein AAFR23_08400 [Pseudomonadota bacterium]